MPAVLKLLPFCACGIQDMSVCRCMQLRKCPDPRSHLRQTSMSTDAACMLMPCVMQAVDGMSAEGNLDYMQSASLCSMRTACGWESNLLLISRCAHRALGSAQSFGSAS